MKDLKMTLVWTSGAIYVVLISIQLVGVQPVENLLSLPEVSSFTLTIEYLHFNAVLHLVTLKWHRN